MVSKFSPLRIGTMLCLLVIFLGAGAVSAHQSTNSYLALSVAEGEVLCQWEVAVGDLAHAIPLDSNSDGNISGGELLSGEKLVLTYALSHWGLIVDGREAAWHLADERLGRTRGGTYTVVYLVAATPKEVKELTVEYRAIFDVDPAHRGLLRLEWNGRTDTAIVSANHQRQTFHAGGGDAWRQFMSFLAEGIRHIWVGFDHVLFLLALLLPSVMARREGSWEPVGSLRRAAVEIVKVVTAFSLAHTVTLTLAMLGWVQPPARWVEAVIALSVILAALNNLRPVLGKRAWMLAFGFGLIHGFGFANALSGDLGLRSGSLALTLIGFNLGVEVGQLAIVAVFLPMAFVLRRSWFYRALVLRGGSAMVCLLAAIWMAERIFAFKLLPFWLRGG